MNICIMCSARNEIKQEYKNVARQIASELAKKGHTIVFGGSEAGLMHEIEKAVFNEKGKLIAIAPEWLNKYEPLTDTCSIFLHVQTLSERKQAFLELSNTFITLPGGVGTLDEFFDILVQKKLERHDKTIIIMNINGYYDKLLSMLDFMIKENTVLESDKELFKVVKTVNEAINIIEKGD